MKRKRRAKRDLVAAATVREIKARKRQFLREVSDLLSDALGFAVRVSMVARSVELSPDQRRASRRSARVNRRSIADSMNAPIVPGAVDAERRAMVGLYRDIADEWFRGVPSSDGTEEPE